MKLVSKFRLLGQRLSAFVLAPSRAEIQFVLFTVGMLLLSGGILGFAHAANDAGTTYDDNRIANAAVTVLTYLEGSFGALVMVVSGIGAILSAAFGQYKAALGCLVVAVGAFILRSFMTTFFNTASLNADSSGGSI